MTRTRLKIHDDNDIRIGTPIGVITIFVVGLLLLGLLLISMAPKEGQGGASTVRENTKMNDEVAATPSALSPIR